MKKLLSIILPVYNEEKNILELFVELSKVLREIEENYDYEIIYVNDGSTDKSLEKLRESKAKDANVKIFNFSRNFGNQAAITCGLNHAKGDFIITMDSDLQDPPELIPELLKKAENGNEIVYTRSTERNDGFFKKITANLYHYIFDKFGSVKIPRHVGDYRLVSRKVLKTINRCDERARFMRGLVAWIGFKYDFVEFKRPKRCNGIPGYTWNKLIKLAFDGFTGFSFLPLKLSAFVGIFVIVTSFGFFSYVAYDFFIKGNHAYPLYKWLIIIVYGFMGIQFILIWLLGEYIGRIYDEQRKRPMYVLDEEENDRIS